MLISTNNKRITFSWILYCKYQDNNITSLFGHYCDLKPNDGYSSPAKFKALPTLSLWIQKLKGWWPLQGFRLQLWQYMVRITYILFYKHMTEGSTDVTPMKQSLDSLINKQVKFLIPGEFPVRLILILKKQGSRWSGHAIRLLQEYNPKYEAGTSNCLAIWVRIMGHVLLQSILTIHIHFGCLFSLDRSDSSISTTRATCSWFCILYRKARSFIKIITGQKHTYPPP